MELALKAIAPDGSIVPELFNVPFTSRSVPGPFAIVNVRNALTFKVAPDSTTSWSRVMLDVTVAVFQLRIVITLSPELGADPAATHVDPFHRCQLDEEVKDTSPLVR